MDVIAESPQPAERIRYAQFFGAYSVDDCLVFAQDLGADLISLIEPYGRHVPAELGAEAYARVCDKAAELGLRVQLEFMPFSGIPDLRSAWEIVCLADRSNGGLVVDTWHFYRGAPDHQLLAEIPPEKVFSVQLSDGPARPEPDLWHAATHDRLLPGTGDFDLATVLRILWTNGSSPTVGPESVSDHLAAMEATDAARRAARATHSTLAAADMR